MRRTHIFVSWGKNKIEAVDDCVSFCARRNRKSGRNINTEERQGRWGIVSLKVCRRLNSNECCPCTARAVKNVFDGVDIDILLGLRRKFEFDTFARKS